MLLSWVWPQGGALLAEKLFLTPTRVPRPPSEADFFNSAKKYTLPYGIAAFEWGVAENPLVVLVHGWSGRGTQMGAFASPLVQAGYRVVALDGPAHGASSGQTTNVGDYAQFLIEAQKILGPFHAVVAHSFGAGCSVLSAQRGLKVKKLVLIAGPAKYERVVGNFFKLLPISSAAQRSFLVNLQRKVGISVQEMNVGEIGKNLRVEALIVHDIEDKEVRFQSAIEIHEAWPTSKIFKTQGLGHRRILRDPQVLSTVKDFIQA